MDIRIIRTKEAITKALLELIDEQRWDKITVQSLLDRTGISRSTFYAHYENKLDILTGNIPNVVDKILVDYENGTVDLGLLIEHVADAADVLGPLLSQPVFVDILNEFEKGFQEIFAKLTDNKVSPWLAIFLAGAVLAVVKQFAAVRTKGDPQLVAKELEHYVNSLLKLAQG